MKRLILPLSILLAGVFLKPATARAAPFLNDTKDFTNCRDIFHRLAGDDLLAYFGFDPEVTILGNSTPNAFAQGPSTIVISAGLLKLIQSEEELAYVLAHELAHLMLGHTYGQLSGHNLNETQLWEQKLRNELEADALALKLLNHSHYSGRSALSVLERLESYGSERGSRLGDVYPSLKLRARFVSDAVSQP